MIIYNSYFCLMFCPFFILSWISVTVSFISLLKIMLIDPSFHNYLVEESNCIAISNYKKRSLIKLVKKHAWLEEPAIGLRNFLLHFLTNISASMEGTHENVGWMLRLCFITQFLEIFHPMVGYTKGSVFEAVVQVEELLLVFH